MLSRRRFLHNAAAATSAALASPLVANVADTASAPSHPSRRALVLIELAGGNDALNTVIPVSEGIYYDHRPTLAIPAGKALMLDRNVGLHPAMRAMHELFGQGKLAIIQGVGYPNPSRSHFRSAEIWHRASTDLATSTGWLWRCWQAMARPVNDGMAPIIAVNAPGLGSRDAGLGQDDECREPGPETLRRRAKAAYPNGRLARGLALFAQMIVANDGPRLFHITHSGFDTHAHQARDHAEALGRLSAAVGAFLADLRAEGRENDVLVMIFSEFGRRLRENGSGGTDHGAAGVMFFAGGGVKGGIYGRQPSLSDLDDGDLKYTTDFRRAYASVVENWFGMEAQGVLGRPYRPLAFV